MPQEIHSQCEINGVIKGCFICYALSTHLFHNGGETTERQAIAILSSNHCTAQLDDQSARILELASVREDGGPPVGSLEGALVVATRNALVGR